MTDPDFRLLDRIRFVLVRTSHPGNIGSAARAIRTMGLRRLSLVAPEAFPHVEATSLAAGATDVVLAPLGFISDHMEVMYDLDTEAAQLCEELGIHMVRAGTAGTHPKFIEMIEELVRERTHAVPRRSEGVLGVPPDDCPLPRGTARCSCPHLSTPSPQTARARSTTA